MVADQFPAWADLPVTPGGWDNRTFRLGGELSVRLPSAAASAAQVAREQRWPPVLAPGLPLAVPIVVGKGRPGRGYPRRWSVLHWIKGESATVRSSDDVDFARALARFLNAMHGLKAKEGPAPGPDNFTGGSERRA